MFREQADAALGDSTSGKLPIGPPLSNDGIIQLAAFLDRQGRTGGAEHVMRDAATRGHWYTREPLITLPHRQAREALAAGEPEAVKRLAQRPSEERRAHLDVS